MTTAQPGQEQRMELRETVARVAFETEVGYAADDRAWERAGSYWLGFADKILAIPELTRPTADLGEDGELIGRLRDWPAAEPGNDALSAGFVATLMKQAADRLILYREALERIARALTGDNELAAILSNIASGVLSRSGL